MKNIEKITTETLIEFEEKIIALKNEGWILEIQKEQFYRFKNEFPILMQQTTYIRTKKLPDYIEIYKPELIPNSQT